MLIIAFPFMSRIADDGLYLVIMHYALCHSFV